MSHCAFAIAQIVANMIHCAFAMAQIAKDLRVKFILHASLLVPPTSANQRCFEKKTACLLR